MCNGIDEQKDEIRNIIRFLIVDEWILPLIFQNKK